MNRNGSGSRRSDRHAHRPERLLGFPRNDLGLRRLHVHERPGRDGLHGGNRERCGNAAADRDQRHLGLHDVVTLTVPVGSIQVSAFTGRIRLPGRDRHLDRAELLLGHGNDQRQRRLRLQRRARRLWLHGIAHLRRHRPADRHHCHRRLDHEHQSHDPGRVDQGDGDESERRGSAGCDGHALEHERRHRCSGHHQRQRHLHLHRHPGRLGVHGARHLRARNGDLVEHDGHLGRDGERDGDDCDRIGHCHRQERSGHGAPERQP